MIRIHVLLLASLLSIWGLTSCENSDTDKVGTVVKFRHYESIGRLSR